MARNRSLTCWKSSWIEVEFSINFEAIFMTRGGTLEEYCCPTTISVRHRWYCTMAGFLVCTLLICSGTFPALTLLWNMAGTIKFPCPLSVSLFRKGHHKRLGVIIRMHLANYIVAILPIFAVASAQSNSSKVMPAAHNPVCHGHGVVASKCFNR